MAIGLLTPTKKTLENAETNYSEKNMDTITQHEKIKVESFKDNNGITLRKYLRANLPSSNLNVKNWYKHRQLGTTNK